MNIVITKMPNFKQQGVTLLIVMIVLLSLTLLGLSSMTDNRMQSVMVRNNQFQFEAFNASYSEIDAQVNFINARSISDGAPPSILLLINGAIGDSLESDSTSAATRMTLLTDQVDMEKTVSETYSGTCTVYGQGIGAGVSQVECSEIQIETSSRLDNTSIDSNQFQMFEYTSLSES